MSFIVIEGANGAGKTSLIKSLSEKGYKTLSSPNGTPLAKMLRPACRGAEPWTDIGQTTQFLLFSAARYDEYQRIVHNSKELVFADRWWTSTYVYQCMLQGIPVPFMEYTIHPEEKIDMVILLDADDNVLVQRVMDERKSNPSHGLCSWTTQSQTIIDLANLYRKELLPYLSKRNIPWIQINTTNLSKDDVLKSVEEHGETIRQKAGEK